MGKYRSKSGCLTCRNRRVKCDEIRPMCGQCGKKSRDCQWESAHTRFRDYRPSGGSSATTTPGGTDETEEREDTDEREETEATEATEGASADDTEIEGADGMSVEHPDDVTVDHGGRKNIRAGLHVHHPRTYDSTPMSPHGAATAGLQQSSASPFLPQVASPTTSIGGGVAIPPQLSSALPMREAYPLSHNEAELVHHYARHLGRWLDGTDPAGQFSLRVPSQVRHCPILLHATMCFAARHRGDHLAADQAYQRCIALLIERLNLNTSTQDIDLLCAIVILRFFEQLNVSSVTGSDNENHLAGSAAILRASQTRTVDPSSPTLREAAFWVYVRQCMYNCTIDQQPPNIDFSLQLEPEPSSMRDHHPLAQIRLETAWANQITWHCACIVNFCFDEAQDRSHRMQRWNELWDAVQAWRRDRPDVFDPIWSGHVLESVFPVIYFTADWHAVAFGYFHFSCILLLSYKPGPKFAIRSVRGKLSETEDEVLQHARAICGSCKSSPSIVPCLITLCHTIFIWGPILSDPAGRRELIELLADFERTHSWPTAWIIKALSDEWGIE